MISVIICSTSEKYLEQVQQSIRTTVGVDFELLSYDNTTENKGICEVYNLLATRARYPYLCFVHEDIIFNTLNWGQVITDIFKDEKVGLIGMAGSKYKSQYFSGWYNGNIEFDCEYIIHQDRVTGNKETIYLNPEPGNKLQEVVCIDGVFICTRKTIWEKVKFNEKDLKGFHFYDIDFSARIFSLCKIMVTYSIEIIHLTHGGDFGDRWLVEAIKWHQQNKSLLPLKLKENNQAFADKMVINSWLDWLKNQNISLRNKIQWIYLQKLHLIPGLYYSIIKFFLYKPLGLKYLHRLVK